MRKLSDLQRERNTMSTIVELTGAFEGISSMHISQIKDQVLASQKYFAELWGIYSQIRVDEFFHFGRSQSKVKPIKKTLFLSITAEGSFSGDIDQKVINAMLKIYDPAKNDIVVIGAHGATQLKQRGVPYAKNFRLPSRDQNIDVAPVSAETQKYESTMVFYPSYVSLMNQQVKSIALSTEVAERGKNITEKPEDIISDESYIFEPSTHAVVDHLESSMIQIMIGEIILESRLAQHASRFKAMNAAHTKSEESYSDVMLQLNRARRHTKDERTKEIINGLRAIRK